MAPISVVWFRNAHCLSVLTTIERRICNFEWTESPVILVNCELFTLYYSILPFNKSFALVSFAVFQGKQRLCLSEHLHSRNTSIDQITQIKCSSETFTDNYETLLRQTFEIDQALNRIFGKDSLPSIILFDSMHLCDLAVSLFVYHIIFQMDFLHKIVVYYEPLTGVTCWMDLLPRSSLQEKQRILIIVIQKHATILESEKIAFSDSDYTLHTCKLRERLCDKLTSAFWVWVLTFRQLQQIQN